MKTITRNFVKRSISVLLVLMMVFSLLTVGLTSASAVEAELAETGAAISAGTILYLKPNGNWKADNARFAAYFFNSTTDNAWVSMVIDDETEGIYSVISPSKSYNNIIFCRMNPGVSANNWNSGTIWNQTNDLSYDGTNNLYTIADGAWSNGSGSWSSYQGSSVITVDFWADVDGNPATEYDKIERDGNKLYLPSAKVTLFAEEGKSFTIDDYTITSAGQEVDLESGTYDLDGDTTGKLTVFRSANVSSIHTITETPVPQGTYQGYDHKDKYNSENDSQDTGSQTQFISVIGPDGTQKNSNTVLKKIKGRGNSSWKASHEIIGKYAFNITLDKKATLIDDGFKSKKYCLVSYNADQARMRNMIAYELAEMIGSPFAPQFEPVDFYNNGKYIGSYLLTDKVEIGDEKTPLVDIVNLDDVNENLNADDGASISIITNAEVYEGYQLDAEGEKMKKYAVDIKHTAKKYDFATGTTTTGSLSTDDTSTKGLYKYIGELDEPDESIYQDSGFLLEFELNERFDAEYSGFISNKGQQIVCKYPEYATEKQILHVMKAWHKAETAMYDEDATYEELDKLIDVESFAKMYLIQELTKNLDSGATSYYVYFDDGKFHAGVAWDYDWALGQYRDDYSGELNGNSDFNSLKDGLPSNYEKWYVNSKEIYLKGDGKTGVLNAQAALCQNDAFWGVVMAEWNEIFYSKATEIVAGTVTSVSDLDGIIADFYNTVKASTAMDEDKWHIIADNPLYAWGSTETGSDNPDANNATHDKAVVYLNNWFYNRLNWMDRYLNPKNDLYPHTAPYNVDYIIQPPTVKTDKELYQSGDTAVLIIDDKTDGDFTYTIYKDGEEIGTTTDKTYEVTAGNKGVANYTVTATSNNSGKTKTSALSNAAKVEVEGFKFVMDVSSPTSVTLGEYAEITANTNSDELVIYTLEDAEGNIIETAEVTGGTTFKILADKVDSYKYTVRAKTTVDGKVFSDYIDVSYEVTAFEFAVTLTGNSNVEAGLDIALKATAQSSSAVSYTFYDENDNIIAENFNGLYSKETTQEDVGKTFSYYVTAKTTVLGKEYTATSEVKTITVVPVSEVYDVTIYFKSTTSYGYWPLITTYGAVNDVEGFKMLKGDTEAIFIGKNSSQTASYYWFKADVQVSKASPTIAVSVLSSRYAMQGDLSLKITESGAIYLAVDDLNAGTALLNLTDWDEAKRNWCQSAVHMVYDDALDGEEKLASVSSTFVMRYVGDANGDGVVNIKDATLIQKSLANLATLDSTATEVSDLTSDGAVTIKDATVIQKQLAGL